MLQFSPQGERYQNWDHLHFLAELFLPMLLLLLSCKVSDSLWPHRWKPTRHPRPWDSPGKNTGVGCHFLPQCVKVKWLSRVPLLATPRTAAYQAPPSMGFSRQEYRSGSPLPSVLWSAKSNWKWKQQAFGTWLFSSIPKHISRVQDQTT